MSHTRYGRPDMNEQRPVARAEALAAVLRCARATAGLLWRRRTHLPREHLGTDIGFADGTRAPVYRETVVDISPVDPCVLVVRFRLRFVRGAAHRLFRWESMLNTPLFVGFPGLVSKLWLAHDRHEVYRGLYEWDGPALAEHYARCLWRVLALVSVPGPVAYRVLPGRRRDDLLTAGLAAGGSPDWWRPVDVRPQW